MNATARLADTGRVKTMAEKTPYADIIHLPHHQSANRPHMSMLNRAAQFSPYAALVGFDGVIAETGRLTNRKVELSENEIELLDQKLMLINEEIQSGRHPEITVTFFVKDEFKEGGAYEKYMGTIKKIDPIKRSIVFYDRAVPIDDVSGVYGEVVDGIETGE